MKWPDFCRCMWGSGGNAVRHALDVDVDGALPVIDLAAFERRVRHHACIVEDDVDAAVLLDCAVDGGLNLRRVGHVRDERGRLAACCARGAYFAYGYPAVVISRPQSLHPRAVRALFASSESTSGAAVPSGRDAPVARYGFAPLAVRS